MVPYTLDGDPILQRYARRLEADADNFRVLRRLPSIEEMWCAPTPPAGPDIVLGVVDIETTGLGADAKVIEIAVTKIALVDGQLASIAPPLTMLEDPGEPLSDEISKITGITDADLAGHRFDEERLAQELADVDALVAFNAKFDGPHLQRRFAGLRHHWICARLDYDWKAAGYEGRSQSALLNDAGLFYEAHRAAVDAWALAILISLPASDGRTIASHMVDRARTIQTRIAATNAPYRVKDDLKARGYRWDVRQRVWTADVEQDDVPTELEFLLDLHPQIRPTLTKVDWFNRHTE